MDKENGNIRQAHRVRFDPVERGPWLRGYSPCVMRRLKTAAVRPFLGWRISARVDMHRRNKARGGTQTVWKANAGFSGKAHPVADYDSLLQYRGVTCTSVSDARGKGGATTALPCTKKHSRTNGLAQNKVS